MAAFWFFIGRKRFRYLVSGICVGKYKFPRKTNYLTRYIYSTTVYSLILFRHRNEVLREIALRLREFSVLPPFRANRSDIFLVNIFSNNALKHVRMPDNDTDTSQRKEISGQKKESSNSSRNKSVRGH